MPLLSPGVSVSVIDESFYVSSGPGTVPLILIATAESKFDSSGVSIADGTTKANAGKLYLITSQRELLTTFGNPIFNSIEGTPIPGHELNEYGLLAAHSYLGIANQAYVIRSDINLAQLAPSDVAPVAKPADGSYWLDLSKTIIGLNKWNASSSKWIAQTVPFLTDATYLNNSFVPLASYPGAIGSFVMVAGDADSSAAGRAENRIYVRGNTAWTLLDSTVTPDVIYRNHTQIPRPDEILDIAITSGGTGYVVGDTISLVGSNTFGAGAKVTVSTVSGGGVITAVTLTVTGSGYTIATLTQQSTTGIGTGATFTGDLLADGDFWIKTTPPNSGTVFAMKVFDEVTSSFVSVDAPLLASRNAALLAYGNNPHAGNLFVHYDYENVSFAVDNAKAEFSIMSHNGKGHVDAIGTVQAPILTSANVLKINGVSVTVPGTPTLANFVAAITNAAIPNIQASITATNTLKLTNIVGQDITVVNGTGNPIADLGLTTNIPIASGYVFSNWSQVSYVSSATAPTLTATAGTYWYNTTLLVDILINNGLGQWDDFAGTLYLQPAKPLSASAGDIWVETDKVDQYPLISVYSGTAWVQVNNTDQTSPTGIVFADARPSPTFGSDLGVNNSGTSGFPDLDADRPDPLLYPKGMMLWNTRYSTNNVKVWTPGYTFAGVLIGDRWVTASGNDLDGSPFMGRHAQRALVVKALKASIDANDAIRADSIFFNLIAAPAYPELIEDMVSLNVDRKQTAFVIGDSPMRLAPTGTAILDWAQNTAGAANNGEKGLVTADVYTGIYYPGSALTSNTDGTDAIVPPSHIALRTMAYNDQVAYQWFAPAGYQRGIVTNAVSVGYITAEDEYVAVELSEGLRDVLYTNNINPIAQRPNRGLVVFGQKTRSPLTSALDRINVARLINYIRYQAPLIAEPFLFEPNDNLTQKSVKKAFDRFLSNLVTLRGLYGFLSVVDSSNNTPVRVDANELWIDLVIQPTKAIEFIYIPVRVRNTGSALTP